MKKDIKGLDNLKKNIVILLVCWTVGIFILLGAYASTKNKAISKKVQNNANAQMNIYAIDTKGDSILLESGGNFILMDAGYKDTSDKVIKYVNSKISKAKLSGEFNSFSLYISEFNDEYIGEVNDVFKKLDVDSLYLQDKGIIENAKEDTENYEKLLKKYDKVVSLAKKEKAEIVALKKGTEVVFGDAKITVIAPLDIDYTEYSSDSNGLNKYLDDTSLVSIVTVGETRYLTTGNISSSMEEKLYNEYENNLDAEIYKLSHYGNNDANSSKFLSYVSPDFSIKTYDKKTKNYINSAVKRTMYYGAAYATDYNGNIRISILNDNVSIYPDDEYIKLNVYYETDDNIELANKNYHIAKRNTLTEKWDFFERNFEGYKLTDIQYGRDLNNITSSLYGVDTFKGIEDINNELDIVLVYKEIQPASISLNSSLVKLDVGDQVSVNALVEPENSKYSKLVWKSDNEKIATVKDGKITGESVGKTTITVSIKNTSIKASCEVIVGDYDSSIDGINLSMKSLTIDKNVQFNLNDYEGNNNISWVVSDPSILSIDMNGVITPIKSGTTVITANLNGYTDRCKVTVTDGLVVTNIQPNTAVSKMADDLKLDNMKVLASYVKYKGVDEIVATGDSLVSIDGNKVTVYAIAVIGDVNGEGQVTDDDVVILKSYLNNERKLSKAAIKAADVNIDGKITKKDLKVLINYVKHKKGYEKLPYRK